MEKPKDRQAVLFQTNIGWMSLEWVDGVVSRLAFGHKTEAAVRKVASVSVTSYKTLPFEKRELVDRLSDYANGMAQTFDDIILDQIQFSPFRRAVTRACRQIPWGQTRSYAQLAKEAGSAGAARAVGRVMASNPFPLMVPCHRVIGASGGLGGFSAPTGLRLKKRLLALESSEVR